MRPEAAKYLEDIRAAAESISDFTAGKSFSDYVSEPMLRSAVERQFEIIGEAMRLLADLDAALAATIPEHRQVIAFRNVLIHGYASVDHNIVWGVIEKSLPGLRDKVAGLLEPANATSKENGRSDPDKT
jgi:uncharacterized protein with HEPN domain